MTNRPARSLDSSRSGVRVRPGHERQGRLDVEPDPLTSPRSIKETFVPPTDPGYPHMT